jgi:phage terminase small subunit
MVEITVATKRNEHNTPEERSSDRENQAVAKEEAKPVTIVECPPELSPTARQEWDRVAPELAAAGLSTVVC